MLCSRWLYITNAFLVLKRSAFEQKFEKDNSLNSIDKTDDLYLSRLVSETVYESYVTALEFINANPDHTLTLFRKIAEEIVTLLATQNKLSFAKRDLFSQIKELLDSQIIHKATYDLLAEIRRSGNEGVHSPNELNLVQSDEDQSSEEFISNRKRDLSDRAHQVRKSMVKVFEDVAYILKNQRVKCIELSPSGIQDVREVIHQAFESMDWKVKFKAGIILESMFVEQFVQTGLRYTAVSNAQLKHLAQSAIGYFDAACEISANLDNRFSHEYDDERSIQKYADVNVLFKFASLALGEPSESELYKKAEARLQAVADRGYEPAEAKYGTFLYSQNKYAKSINYLESAAQSGEPLALNSLHLYYSEGKACKEDFCKAKLYLDQALETGDPDAYAYLGLAYTFGKVLPQDIGLARKYLKKAADQGSVIGRRKLLEHDIAADLQQEMIREVEDFKEYSKAFNSQLPLDKVKVGRNEACPCGSGKKYKKCCGSPTHKPKNSFLI